MLLEQDLMDYDAHSVSSYSSDAEYSISVSISEPDIITFTCHRVRIFNFARALMYCAVSNALIGARHLGAAATRHREVSHQGLVHGY